MPIINSVCEKVCFTINRLLKMLFSFFQISNGHCQKSYAKTMQSLFIMNFEGIIYILFYDGCFLNDTAVILRLFSISTEMHFVSLFFLNERNITSSLLMIYLKCAVVHYANLNSISINKIYLRAVCYFVFFNVLFIFVLTKLLPKTL